MSVFEKHMLASEAQWIERLSPEQKVVGSNPIKPTEQAVAPVLRGGFTRFWVLGYRPECVSGGGQVGGCRGIGGIVECSFRQPGTFEPPVCLGLQRVRADFGHIFWPITLIHA